MKKAILGVGVAALVVVVGLVAVVATRPSHMHIERSTSVAAAPSDVYAVLADQSRFSEWSPWDDLDPQLEWKASDPPTGMGAWYEWHGNKDVGSGKMTITGLEPDVRVAQRIAFLEPMANEADITFSLAPAGDATKVTWAFDGENDLMGKAFSMVVDMDAMLGKDFSRGLDQLKGVAEADATKRKAREEADRLADEQAAMAATAAAVAPPAGG